MNGQCSSTLILRSRGPGFLAWMRFFTFSVSTLLMLLGGMRPNVLWRMRRNWQPNSPETQLALGYYQYYVLRDYRAR